MNEILKQLKSQGIDPKKRFGQNFLINKKVYEFILDFADVQRGNLILEIGGGTGILTNYLIERGAKVITIEKDRELIEMLRKNTSAEVVEGDVLDLDAKNLVVNSGKFKLVANIPYYLTSRLIRNFLVRWPTPELIVIMVQHEVAKRLVAKPPNMNLLGLSVQLYADVEIGLRVKKSSFWPEPKVDSAVIKIKPNPLLASDKAEKVIGLAKKAFSMKRKKLLNSLSGHLDALKKADIDPNKRPQDLSWDDWIKLESD